MASQAPLRVEFWSDLICPFCWIGKRHLEEALARLEGTVPVEVVHRAYQLDPHAKESRPLREYLERRFGGAAQAQGMTRHVSAMGAGANLTFDWERAVSAPTFDAHRLVRFARARGAEGAMVERLMRAHFTEGSDLGDQATLQGLAEQVGLDPTEVREALEGDAHAEDVRADIAEARRLGANGVPFFVIDGRYGISGAQPVELFVQALQRAQQERGAAAHHDAGA